MVWELLTNPVLVAVAVLLALSALRMNVVFALVVASVVGGLMGAVDGGEAWAMLGHGEFHAFWNCCVGGFSGTMKAFLSNLDNGAVLAESCPADDEKGARQNHQCCGCCI